jgi:hypothetical protein
LQKQRKQQQVVEVTNPEISRFGAHCQENANQTGERANNFQITHLLSADSKKNGVYIKKSKHKMNLLPIKGVNGAQRYKKNNDPAPVNVLM